MITGRYEYCDASGNLLYWKERVEPGRNGLKKEFIFYHGTRKYGRNGHSVLYRLPQVIASKAVILTEGEKQADLLADWGLCGTSLDSGAGSKMPPAMAEMLAGKRVVILRDNDEAGLRYAEKVAKTLQGQCESLRVVLLPDLPDKGDIMDWQGDKAQLLEVIKAAPEWIPVIDPPKVIREQRPMTSGDITQEMIEIACQYPIGNLIEIKDGKALCLAHKEKTPSMVYYADKNRVHCFGCGFSGSAIDVIRIQDELSFPQAVRFLQ